jgi:hypothetical protein
VEALSVTFVSDERSLLEPVVRRCRAWLLGAPLATTGKPRDVAHRQGRKRTITRYGIGQVLGCWKWHTVPR